MALTLLALPPHCGPNRKIKIRELGKDGVGREGRTLQAEVVIMRVARVRSRLTSFMMV